MIKNNTKTTSIIAITFFAALMLIPTGMNANASSCPVGHIDNGDGTCTFDYTEGDRKGVYRSTACGGTIYDKTGVQLGHNTVDCMRDGWYFDISSIDDDATINSVKVRYDVTSDTSFQSNGNSCIFKSYEGTLSTDSVSTRFTDLGDGTTFTTTTSCGGVSNDKVQDLSSSAVSDLEAELAIDDEWAVSVISDDENTSHGVHLIVIDQNTFELQVVYTPPLTIITVEDLQNQINSLNSTINQQQLTITTLNSTVTTLNTQVSVIDTLVDYIDTFLNGIFINYDP